MTAEAIEHYLGDDSRRGPAGAGSVSGAAGGAPCGDLIRVSLELDGPAIARVSQDAEGCAASRAAAAAVAELVEGSTILEAAAVGPDLISEELGGLAPTHRHAAELAADALHRALSALAGSGELLAAAPDGAERVLVALSGGVDSAVAALLERERGAEVVAVTLKLWADQATDGERSCCSPEAVLRARRLAHSLGIPHLTLDLEPEFRAGVVRPFIDGYAAGETPNPCVLCNGEVRLDAMIALADRLGASALVTGHYARIADDGEGPLLSRADDEAKDQTYMLAGLAPSSLARLRFPLASLAKPRVRELAASAELEVAGRAESQDLCFLAGQGKREFLRRHAGLGERPGESSTPKATGSAHTAATTTSPSASAAASASPRASRSTCWAPTRPPTASRSARRSSSSAARSACAAPAFTATPHVWTRSAFATTRHCGPAGSSHSTPTARPPLPSRSRPTPSPPARSPA